MKKILLFTVLIFFIVSCSSLKNTQEAINNGNYDSAINTAIKNLKRNKTKKGNQPYSHHCSIDVLVLMRLMIVC